MDFAVAGVGGGSNRVGGGSAPNSVGLFGVVDIPWGVIASGGEGGMLGWVAIRSGVDFPGDMGVVTGGGEMEFEGKVVAGIVWLPFGIDRRNMAYSGGFGTAPGPTKPRQHNQ